MAIRTQFGAKWTIKEDTHYEVVEAIFGKRNTELKLVGSTISLIHIDDYDKIPDGTELITIFGVRKIKGKDYIELDDRGGWLGVGTLDS